MDGIDEDDLLVGVPVRYAPGGVPPVGHRTAGLPTYIDDSLQRYEQLYAAGGDSNAIFPITLQQLIDVSDGKMVDVARRDEPAE